MTTDLIHDRGRGPEIIGTRITVYNLLPYFLDPTATEAYICKLYELTPEQVAAARGYVFNHLDTVLTKHLEIEARLAAGYLAQTMEQPKQLHPAVLNFRKWLAEREQAEAQERAAEAKAESAQNGARRRFPSFREWFAERESHSGEGT